MSYFNGRLCTRFDTAVAMLHTCITSIAFQHMDITADETVDKVIKTG